MTKTQYYTATSVDGFIADENNSLQWLFDVERAGAPLLPRRLDSAKLRLAGVEQQGQVVSLTFEWRR
jgi:hypothetical protein